MFVDVICHFSFFKSTYDENFQELFILDRSFIVLFQMKLLLSKRDSGSPLFLKLVCDELRLFGVYEKLIQHIRALPQNIPKLIEFSFSRIETESGKQLILDTFSLLYFSRQGMYEVCVVYHMPSLIPPFSKYHRLLDITPFVIMKFSSVKT